MIPYGMPARRPEDRQRGITGLWNSSPGTNQSAAHGVAFLQ